MFLWMDTLVPLGPQEASVATLLGEANSLVTLLVAGAAMAASCIIVNKNKAGGRRLFAVALIIFGGFFFIYSLVAVWVHVYWSFWYLTDTWLLSLPILGAALLIQGKA